MIINETEKAAWQLISANYEHKQYELLFSLKIKIVAELTDNLRGDSQLMVFYPKANFSAKASRPDRNCTAGIRGATQCSTSVPKYMALNL
jgi:hypothetical protein